MNFDVDASVWEQQFFYHHPLDAEEDLPPEKIIESFKHTDDEWLLEYIWDELETFEEDDLISLTTYALSSKKERQNIV
jgi:hypothetical protein